MPGPEHTGIRQDQADPTDFSRHGIRTILFADSCVQASCNTVRNLG